MKRASRTFRYTVERAASGRFVAMSRQFANLIEARKFAKHRLTMPATLTERELLPLGCEVINRVGTIDQDGTVRWRR